MSEERYGEWVQTHSGVQFWVLDPQPEDVRIEDIAHHLAMQCRFNGACQCFYSVAQHCVLVSEEVERRLTADATHRLARIAWGLLHDAAEAYLGDMVRPLKRHMPEFRAAERAVMDAVLRRTGWLADVLPEEPPEVRTADTVLLMTERRDLMPDQLEWNFDERAEPLPQQISPLLPWGAERIFLRRAAELRARILEEQGWDLFPGWDEGARQR